MGVDLPTIIESIGTYLPDRALLTSEVLAGCEGDNDFPLERIAGITSRPEAGADEFSIDLARAAVADCLAHSRYDAAEIDLLICCNISRYDGPEQVFFEPSTSIRLKGEFGFSNAQVFDVSNACAGMFTGIYVMDAFLKAGAIRRGMVVSGEFITHLTRTAQKEMENYLDPRLACLTLGDAGAAVILERSSRAGIGFQEMDLRTFGSYSSYCIAKPSENGGYIMLTDSMNLSDVGVRYGARHAAELLARVGWSPEEVQHLIMHQTSTATIRNARREINRLLNNEVFNGGNAIDNLKERGNTASTSHFVALADSIRNQRIHSGDKMVFCVSASGLTTGTALYVFDDLPDRIRQNGQYNGNGAQLKQELNGSPGGVSKPVPPALRVESIGTIPGLPDEATGSLELLQAAAEQCLQASRYRASDIELLIYTGVYRSDNIVEPAYAALLAGALAMNGESMEPGHKKTLAFDVFNGAVGFLNACELAQQMIAAGKCSNAMVVAAECNQNAGHRLNGKLGIQEAASAVILDAAPAEGPGLRDFRFFDFPDLLDRYETSLNVAGHIPFLQVEKDERVEALFRECIDSAVRDYLQSKGLDIEQIDYVLPPQISPGFTDALADALGLPADKFVSVPDLEGDLFTSSTAFTLERVRSGDRVKAGDLGLLITVGSGIQVGCALHRYGVPADL